MEYTFSTLWPYSVHLTIAYFTFVVVYRLYLSPLAKFPGPKLAAATRLVELYYEVFHEGGGKYLFQIKDMHKKYGPIVRISPYELHIDDAEFYPELFTGAQSRSADICEFGFAAMGEQASGSTVDGNRHRMRRKAVNPYFSKASVYKIEPLLWKYTKRLCERFDEYRIAKKPVKLGPATLAHGMDILSYYCFELSYDHLELPDFGEVFHTMDNKGFKMIAQMKYFPWLMKMIFAAPEWLVLMSDPDMYTFFGEKKLLKDKIEEIEKNRADNKTPERRNLIQELFDDKSLPPEERTTARVSDEASFILESGAATSPAIDCCIVHILSDKEVERKLRECLFEVMADYPEKQPRLADLEKIDYLRGVVYESLRFAYGAAHRIQRVMSEPIQYKNWEIPARTPVGMSAPFIHHDEATYYDSYSFIPERWIETRGLPVTKRFAAFGKGPRICTGMNLVYAEFYILLAMLFRPGAPKLELYETDLSDVALVHDYFKPFPSANSKGVRLMLS